MLHKIKEKYKAWLIIIFHSNQKENQQIFKLLWVDVAELIVGRLENIL